MDVYYNIDKILMMYYKYTGGYSTNNNIYYYNFNHNNLDHPKNSYFIFEEIKFVINKYYKFHDICQNSIYLLYILHTSLNHNIYKNNK